MQKPIPILLTSILAILFIVYLFPRGRDIYRETLTRAGISPDNSKAVFPGEKLLDAKSFPLWKRFSPHEGRFPLAKESPWSFDPQTGILSGNSSELYEMLMLQKPLERDGVLHVEWRYVGKSAKPDSGVLLRAEADGSRWTQAQLATAGLGTLATKNPGGYKPPTSGTRRPDLFRPWPAWNEMKVTLSGPRIILEINGTRLAELEDCPLNGRHIGLQLEFSPIEFRNIYFLPAENP